MATTGEPPEPGSPRELAPARALEPPPEAVPAQGEPRAGPRCPPKVTRALGMQLVGRTAVVLQRPAARDPDTELLARWREGDEAAFERLVERYQGRIFRFLVRLLGDAADAEDVAQEALLNLHRHGLRFRGEARFSTFVYRVAANAALNRRRSLGRYRARVRRLAERQAAGDDLPSGPRDPESAAAGGETDRLVQRALLELPVPLRLPLVLYDIEGLPYAEIAAGLGLAEGTVKSRIHRARRALRELLRPLLERREEGA